MGKVIFTNFFTFHDLNENANAFIIVSKVFGMTIDQRVGIHNACINLGDGMGQGGKAFGMCTLIGQKDAFIFTSEGCAKIIFQQTGGANDQRTVTRFKQNAFKAFNNFRWKFAFVEFLAKLWIVLAHLCFRLVLLSIPPAKFVQRHEVVVHIRTKIIRDGQFEAVANIGGRRLSEDTHGEQHPCGFTTDLSAADLAPVDLTQVFHCEPLTCDLDVLQLVTDHGADQHGDDGLKSRFVFFLVCIRHRLDHLCLFKKQFLRGKFGVDPDKI